MRFFNSTIVALAVTITGFMVTTIDAASTPTNVGRATMRKTNSLDDVNHHQRRLVTRANKATWMVPDKDACTKGKTTSPRRALVAGINKNLYNDLNEISKHCGKCAHVKGPKGSVVVKIIDACRECEEHSLDMSRAAFARIGDLKEGVIPIKWTWGPCEQSLLNEKKNKPLLNDDVAK